MADCVSSYKDSLARYLSTEPLLKDYSIRRKSYQAQLIQSIADTAPQNVFLWGYSGTGKTLFLCEALKIKLSKLRRLRKEGKKVSVVVTVFNPNMIESKFSDSSGSSLIRDLKGTGRLITLFHRF